MRFNDALVGLLFMALAGLMLVAAQQLPAFPGQKYGPSLFPTILGTAIIACGALLVLRGLAARRAGAGWVAREDWTREPARLLAFLAVPGAVVAYLLLAERLGFVPVAFLLLLGLSLLFGARRLTALGVALAMTVLTHWFFGSLMRVPLPRGLWADLIERVI